MTTRQQFVVMNVELLWMDVVAGLEIGPFVEIVNQNNLQGEVEKCFELVP